MAKIGYITNKERDHVRKITGDKKMSKERIRSGKWMLPSELDVSVYKYLKRKGKMK